MITKNFSNYSAWHYRAKLLPKVYSQNDRLVNLGYIIPFDKFKEDMATLKHAFFTDPKDQSPWNYHQWLLIQISPIQVTHVELVSQSADKTILALSLSHKLRNFQNLNITIDGNQAEVQVYEDRELLVLANADTIAQTWFLELKAGAGLLRVEQPVLENDQEQSDAVRFCHSLEGVTLFRSFSLQIDNSSVSVVSQDQEESLVSNLVSVLTQEFSTIKELTDFEPGLQFATHRMLDLKQLLFNYTCNPWY